MVLESPEPGIMLSTVHPLYGRLTGRDGYGAVYINDAGEVATKLFARDIIRREIDAIAQYGGTILPRFIGEVEGGYQMEALSGIQLSNFHGAIDEKVFAGFSSELGRLYAGGTGIKLYDPNPDLATLNPRAEMNRILAMVADRGCLNGLD